MVDKKYFIEENILLADKPKGISSFDVIRRLRKILGIRKMGHAGTLDPLASGLMILGIGDGTKKLSSYIKLPKTYVTEVLIGKSTETGDLEGEILDEKDARNLKEEEISKVVLEIKGKLELPVPIYSAVKVGGKRLYKIARESARQNSESQNFAEQTKPPVKTMEVLNAKLLKVWQEENFKIAEIEMEVSSGTYVRSVAEEIGRRLGFPACVKELRRTKIAEFEVDKAFKLEL
jgi:tRNA pseudouridine55 synthase